jgi:hypothetical protein
MPPHRYGAIGGNFVMLPATHTYTPGLSAEGKSFCPRTFFFFLSLVSGLIHSFISWVTARAHTTHTVKSSRIRQGRVGTGREDLSGGRKWSPKHTHTTPPFAFWHAAAAAFARCLFVWVGRLGAAQQERSVLSLCLSGRVTTGGQQRPPPGVAGHMSRTRSGEANGGVSDDR